MLAKIISGKCKHAAKFRHAFRPPFTERFEHHFCIALRFKTMSALFEFGSQFCIVVDFAVVDQHSLFIVRNPGLMSMGKDHKIWSVLEVSENRLVMVRGTKDKKWEFSTSDPSAEK